MTKEQILAMQPGRELDALVKEKVFGAEIIKTELDPQTKPPLISGDKSADGIGDTVAICKAALLAVLGL